MSDIKIEHSEAPRVADPYKYTQPSFDQRQAAKEQPYGGLQSTNSQIDERQGAPKPTNYALEQPSQTLLPPLEPGTIDLSAPETERQRPPTRGGSIGRLIQASRAKLFALTPQDIALGVASAVVVAGVVYLERQNLNVAHMVEMWQPPFPGRSGGGPTIMPDGNILHRGPITPIR